MGCAESIENKVLKIEESIKQVLEADTYMVDNMYILGHIHEHKQEHIIGDLEYLKKDDETRKNLRIFLSQLRSLDLDLIERLYSDFTKNDASYREKQLKPTDVDLIVDGKEKNLDLVTFSSNENRSLKAQELKQNDVKNVDPSDPDSQQHLKILTVNDHANQNYYENLKKDAESYKTYFKTWVETEEGKNWRLRKTQNVEKILEIQKQEAALQQKRQDRENAKNNKLTKEQKDKNAKDRKTEAEKSAASKLQETNEKKDFNMNEQILLELESELFYLKKDNTQAQPLKMHDFIDNWSHLSEPERYWKRGLKEIAKGRVGVVFIQGDNGRLQKGVPNGFANPNLNSQKVVFQYLFERIEAVQRLALEYRPDRAIFRPANLVHVFILTAPDDYEETQRLFRASHYFGLWKSNVHFFKQGTLPVVYHGYKTKDSQGNEKDMGGKIVLDDKLNLKMVTDGSGGVFEAIEREHYTEYWRRFGIKYIHVMEVDNLLAKPCDPFQIGMLRGTDGLETGLDLVVKAVQFEDKDKGFDEENEEIKATLNSKKGTAHLRGLVLNKETSRLHVAENVNTGLQYLNNFAIRVDTIQNIINAKDYVIEDIDVSDRKNIKVDQQRSKESWATYHVRDGKLDHTYDPNTQKQTPQELASKIFYKEASDAWSVVHPKRIGVCVSSKKSEYAPLLNSDDLKLAALRLSAQHFGWLTAYHYKFDGKQVSTQVYVDQDAEKQKAAQNDNQAKEEEKNAAQQEKQGEVDKQVEKGKKDLQSFLSKQIWYNPTCWFDVYNPNQQHLKENRQQLVEIDTRLSFDGENIPYLEKSDIQSRHMDLYLEATKFRFKPTLLWWMQDVYRYM